MSRLWTLLKTWLRPRAGESDNTGGGLTVQARRANLFEHSERAELARARERAEQTYWSWIFMGHRQKGKIVSFVVRKSMNIHGLNKRW